MLEQKNSEDPLVKDAKVFAMVAYWPFLCILPLILKKDNKFAVFHGKQGLVLFVFLVGGFIFNVIPFLGQIVFRIILFIYLLFMLFGTIQVLMGRYARIPIVSGIAEKISL